jgi:hypothetical protein
MTVVASQNHASPAVLTIELPARVSSTQIGDRLAAAGYLLNYQSGYLAQRNWIQISLMGDYARTEINSLLRIFLEATAAA